MAQDRGLVVYMTATQKKEPFALREKVNHLVSSGFTLPLRKSEEDFFIKYNSNYNPSTQSVT